MEHYICIHGHFYQPPRENPWLEAIEVQDSAYPYHDWNQRIAVECYAPNRASRILDAEGRIDKIVNNYSRMSFNFGPTLLAWMQSGDPETYQEVLAADKESQTYFGGHGSALAQAYNHMIMPLASGRDKQTQVIWGIRDFQFRFGRDPQGMWLPETAVNLETLDVLAEHGMKFTILSPYQARRARPIGGRNWRDVSGGRIDPTMAYQIRLPSGRSLALFFYDGPISHGIAFEGLLKDGRSLAGRLLGGFSATSERPQLVNVSTDGETFGHHQKFGDMALAYAVHQIDTERQARVTNYAEFLAKQPPVFEVQIYENSSWSCAHGVERWRSDCGCNSGANPGWKQTWRAPLRDALDHLRDRVAPQFERHAGRLFNDPWAARNAYIEVVLDRSPGSIDAFFARYAKRALHESEIITGLKLLEQQRHAMLMYTSCGWFFDEISGIETIQVLQYAGRVLQLAQELFGDHLEAAFLRQLEKAPSNIPDFGNGRRIYERFVKPNVVDLAKVCAHYAVSSLFEDFGEHSRIFCYGVHRQDFRLLQSGKVRLALGKATVKSEITLESQTLTIGVVHLGDQNLTGGVGTFEGDEAYERLVAEISEVFSHDDIPELIRIVDKNFSQGIYSLKLLFRDQQRKIAEVILESTRVEAEGLYRRFYEEHSGLMRFLTDVGLPQPRPLKLGVEFLLNADLRRALESSRLDRERIRTLLEEAKKASAKLDVSGLEYVARLAVLRLAREFRREPEDLHHLQALHDAIEAAKLLPFEVNLWEPQNLYYEVLEQVYPEVAARLSENNDEAAQAWYTHFRALGEQLRVRVPVLEGVAQ